MAPEVFGPFRTLQQIGAGTLGPVFRALQPETDCVVAVKVFSLGLPDDRLRQLLAHLDTLVPLSLDHLNIAAPLAAGTSGASAYLVQELASGDSLDVMHRDRLVVRAADVARLTTDIAAALDFAAAAGVVHGRLNPRDVIVSPQGLRLTGLGVARAIEDVGVAAPLRDPYAAPERVAALPWGAPADTFSLAAMMFELLWGDSIPGLGQAAVEGVEDVPGANLPMLRRAFARALAADPTERFESAGAFATAIATACAPALSLEGTFRRRHSPLTGASPAHRRPVPTVKVVHTREHVITIPAPCVEPPCVEPPCVVTADVEAPGVEPRPVEAACIEPAAMMEPAPAEPEAPIVATCEAPASIAAAPRRYSVWWPFVLGPVVGAAIGYALVPAFDRYRHDPAPREMRSEERAPGASSQDSPAATIVTRMSGTRAPSIPRVPES